MEYCKVQNYSMKCRLYPNKEQAEYIDRAINAVRLYTNMCIYNLFNYFDGTNESKDKNGNIVHWINLKHFTKKSYLENARLKDSRVNDVPANALSGQNGCISTDLKKRLLQAETIYDRAAKEKAKKEGKKYKRNVPTIENLSNKIKYPVEKLIPPYYSKRNPRMSFTYQEDVFKKISVSENKNVFYIKLMGTKTNKINSAIKIRGWNQKIRFGSEHNMDFLEWIEYCRNTNANKRMTVCVKKDNRGYYWIIFKIPECYVATNNIKEEEKIGIDVGIKDIIITSDSLKFENKRFKQKVKRKIKALNRRISRRMGWANISFRELYKVNRTTKVSKRYDKTVKRLSKIHGKIANKRDVYNNEITKQIVDAYSFIGVETLQVSNMFRNRHLSFALSDACMGDILTKLNYKAKWHRRILVAIDQWKPSTKRCSHCGYIRPKISLSTREWSCPECNTHHDRDVNAAKNILYYALLLYEEENK